MGDCGANRQRAGDDQNQSVELHAGVATPDERQEKIETGGEIGQEEREQQTTEPPRWPARIQHRRRLG